VPHAASLRIEVLDPARRAGTLRRLVAHVARAVERRAGLHGTVTLLLAGDARLRQLNWDFRHLDTPTDVLAFPAGDDAARVPSASQHGSVAGRDRRDAPGAYLGDIAISLDRVFAQGPAYGHSVEREFAYLLAHGLLHLAGLTHSDPSATRAMRALEEGVLDELGLTRDSVGVATVRRAP